MRDASLNSKLRSRNLLELSSGGPRNFFLVHDGDGNAQVYQSLAHRLHNSVSVFGIAPRSIAGVPLADTCIEDMAGFYVNEMRMKQPQGPYLVGGLCAGGVIAYEMASQLMRDGEIVELILFEAAAPRASIRPGRTANRRLARLNEALADAVQHNLSTFHQAYSVIAIVSRKVVTALIWEITKYAKLWGTRVRFSLLRQLLKRQLRWPNFIPELSVVQIYECAEARYFPKPLHGGSVTLVRARRRTPNLADTPFRAIYTDETFGWGALVQRVTFIDTDGGHSTMLQEPFVGSLAEALLPLINQEHRPIATAAASEGEVRHSYSASSAYPSLRLSQR